ncbi:peptide deformylase [Streptomyces sp. NPDC058735]|uniref:peptide deformylase n=1 Tax=unclassified Streptomyces TaxID=2593676 RepID=UPI0036CE9BF3
MHRPGAHLRQGLGIAAPQIGITRAAAVVQPAESGAGPIVVLNPRVTDVSEESDEQYEGYLSFFNVRGKVSRPLRMTVETTSVNGATVTNQRGLDRLVKHEIDHLDGLLDADRMRSGCLSALRSTGRSAGHGRTTPDPELPVTMEDVGGEDPQ